MNSNSPNNSGFTLLEVLISMAILVFISLGIYQATTSAFRLREELYADGEFYTAIRLSMGLINRDVMLAYSPTILLNPKKKEENNPNQPPGGGANPPIPQARGPSQIDETGIPAATAAELNQSFTFWQAATDKSGLRPSHFIGNETKMSFISASNFRVYRDSPESELQKVTYEVKRDDDPPVNGFKADNSSVLVKSASANAFDNDDFRDKTFTHTYPLLRGITRFKFTYYKWVDNAFKAFNSWDSDKEDFRNQFPDVIEVTLEVQGPTRLSFEGTYRFRPEIPLRGLNPSF